MQSLKAETKPWHNTGAGSWRINYACCVFLNWILPAWSAAFRLSAGSLQKRRKTRQEALKKAQRNALKENSGWEVKLVKLPTASLCRRRVYTDFPALRGGEKSFAEHEKQKAVWKTCSLWTISSQIICFRMRQNKGDTKETTENRVKGCIWRNQSTKESPKAVNTRTSSWEQNRHPCIFWKQGLGMAELEDSPITEFTQKTGVISVSSLLAIRSLQIFKVGLIMIF